MNYAVFTDESYITAHRFRSIAAYSFPYPILERVKDDIATLLRESSVKEFKWKELKGAKYKFCAIKIVDYVLRTVVEDDARVDVVTWDTQDSRHSVKNRNDDANFERMYFHLISASMKRRPRESKWGVCPDEKNGIDWKTINKCLSAIVIRTNSSISLFAEELKQHFHVVELKQIESHNTPPLLRLQTYSLD